MRILIANDDGIYSPGLRALAEIASGFGEVCVFAPDVEQSSMGHAITHSRPLRVRKTPLGAFEAYRVNGTPADCVALGLDYLKGADLVLSGINLGSNLGNATWHSGTLAAAKQAVLLGCRGIALSTPTGGGEPDFAALAPYVTSVLELLLAADTLRLVNVNFPPQPRGLFWTRMAVRAYDGHVVPMEDPLGRRVYWLSIRAIEQADEGTDLWALRNHYVSLTPLRLDLTDQSALDEARLRWAQPEAGATTGTGTPPDPPPSPRGSTARALAALHPPT
jgi:5'-nucleotidase